jgi:predicted amino acid dehydrogenase
MISSGGQVTIQDEVEPIGNSCIIVEQGGALVIDGGRLSNIDLVLRAGSSLHVFNGGVIETRNDFVAPVGAIINITHGEITKYIP